MKKNALKIISRIDPGCMLIGTGMGLFTGMLTAVTSGEPIFILGGINCGLAFGFATGIAKQLQKLPSL